MYKVLILGLSLLFVESCLKPELVDLEFFEVSMEQPVAVAVGELTLKGNVTALNVDACGFYYAETVAALLSISGADSIQSALPVNGFNFELQFKGLLQGQTLYFRSFARKGKRTVYSDVVSYGLGQLVSLVNTPSKQNDTMIVLGQVSGIKAQHLDADGYGHVYSSLNKIPEVGALECDSNDFGTLNDDLIYTSRISGLNFNTWYYVRAYIRVGATYYYSKTVDSVRIDDGWRQVASPPLPYQSGSGLGVDDEGKAFISFGCNSSFCYQDGLPDDFLSYTPDADTGSWGNQTPYNGSLKCTNAAMFQIGDTIYVFGGEAEVLSFGITYVGEYFKKYCTKSDKWVVGGYPPLPRRTRAVAFSLGNNKGYIGAGRNTSGQLNDFWEYDPANGSWRPVAHLPQKIGMNDPITYGGREGAAVFSDLANAYVGGGQTGGTFLHDFWQFTPPPGSSPQDTGQWTYVSFFEGLGRTGAVSFSIDGHGYYGLGDNSAAGTLSDFWEFNFTDHQWIKKLDFPGGRRRNTTCFSLLNKGYVMGGTKFIVGDNGITMDFLPADCWQYTPNNN